MNHTVTGSVVIHWDILDSQRLSSDLPWPLNAVVGPGLPPPLGDTRAASGHPSFFEALKYTMVISSCKYCLSLVSECADHIIIWCRNWFTVRTSPFFFFSFFAGGIRKKWSPERPPLGTFNSLFQSVDHVFSFGCQIPVPILTNYPSAPCPSAVLLSKPNDSRQMVLKGDLQDSSSVHT